MRIAAAPGTPPGTPTGFFMPSTLLGPSGPADAAVYVTRQRIDFAGRVAVVEVLEQDVPYEVQVPNEPQRLRFESDLVPVKLHLDAIAVVEDAALQDTPFGSVTVTRLGAAPRSHALAYGYRTRTKGPRFANYCGADMAAGAVFPDNFRNDFFNGRHTGPVPAAPEAEAPLGTGDALRFTRAADIASWSVTIPPAPRLRVFDGGEEVLPVPLPSPSADTVVLDLTEGAFFVSWRSTGAPLGDLQDPSVEVAYG